MQIINYTNERETISCFFNIKYERPYKSSKPLVVLSSLSICISRFHSHSVFPCFNFMFCHYKAAYGLLGCAQEHLINRGEHVRTECADLTETWCLENWAESFLILLVLNGPALILVRTPSLTIHSSSNNLYAFHSSHNLFTFSYIYFFHSDFYSYSDCIFPLLILYFVSF